jgi:DNA-binding MarR family transcriptional regulator
MGATGGELRALMAAIVRFVSNTNRATADAFDPAWLSTLRHLVTSGPACQGELSEALDMSPSAVYRQVRTLVEEKLAVLARTGEDRSRWMVSATQAGKEELDQIDEVGAEFFGAVIERWTSDEVRVLTTLLTRLLDDWVRFQQSADYRVRRGDEG